MANNIKAAPAGVSVPEQHTSIIKGTASTAQPIMRVFTTASALALLWQKSSDTMSQPELEWFADGAAEQIGREARTLADVLEGTACMVANDEDTGSFQDSNSTSKLLFNVQNQLNTIAGLADIAADAGFMVRASLKKGGAA